MSYKAETNFKTAPFYKNNIQPLVFFYNQDTSILKNKGKKREYVTVFLKKVELKSFNFVCLFSKARILS